MGVCVQLGYAVAKKIKKSNNGKLNDIAKLLAKINGMFRSFRNICVFVDEDINNLGPMEFISLIHNAEYVSMN
jgi:hypothetical protein